MGVDAMTQRHERVRARSLRRSHARAAFGVHMSVASHHARRRRNGRTARRATTARRRCSSTTTDRSRRSSNDPEAARPAARVVDVLAALVDVMGRVGVVSGRPLYFLAEQCRLPGLRTSGRTGSSRARRRASRSIRRSLPFLDRHRRSGRARPTRWPAGVYVERKARIRVTLHYRHCDDRARRGERVRGGPRRPARADARCAAARPSSCGRPSRSTRARRSTR